MRLLFCAPKTHVKQMGKTILNFTLKNFVHLDLAIYANSVLACLNEKKIS